MGLPEMLAVAQMHIAPLSSKAGVDSPSFLMFLDQSRLQVSEVGAWHLQATVAEEGRSTTMKVTSL